MLASGMAMDRFESKATPSEGAWKVISLMAVDQFRDHVVDIASGSGKCPSKYRTKRALQLFHQCLAV